MLKLAVSWACSGKLRFLHLRWNQESVEDAHKNPWKALSQLPQTALGKGDFCSLWTSFTQFSVRLSLGSWGKSLSWPVLGREEPSGWQGMFYSRVISCWRLEHSLRWGLTWTTENECLGLEVKDSSVVTFITNSPCLGHWTAFWQEPHLAVFLVAWYLSCPGLLWEIWPGCRCCVVITAVCDNRQRGKKVWLILLDEGKAKCLLPECIFSRYWWHLYLYQWWSETIKSTRKNSGKSPHLLLMLLPPMTWVPTVQPAEEACSDAAYCFR